MLDLNSLPLPELFQTLTGDGSLDRLVEAALREDLGERGDITSMAIVSAEEEAQTMIAAREAGVVAGLAAAPRVVAALDPRLAFTAETTDGQRCSPGQHLGQLRGSLRSILTVERTLLNILGRLCGVATLTRRYVEAVSGTRALICDTRKTTPGMRALEKYAVRCGGGTLHRLGLFDAALFKDNHLAKLDPSQMTAALSRAAAASRAAGALRFVEVEVDTLEQLSHVLQCQPGLIDMILLDNMSLADLRRAAQLRSQSGRPVLLEASGGINLANVRAVAETGVDRIAVGAITHSAAALDVGLDFVP